MDSQLNLPNQHSLSQFHYGSIQMKMIRIMQVRLELSQFHYGSIQIPKNNSGVCTASKSQFHYGSIQINRDVDSPCPGQWGLNSTMVRFKWTPTVALEIDELVSIPLWFDSNTDNIWRRCHLLLKSQFHYGSIQMIYKEYRSKNRG